MARVVAISGGDLSTTENLNKYALSLTGKANPHVLFIGTASEDAEGYIENMTKVYARFGCEVKPLRLETVSYSEEELDELFSWADVIYVGGGDTHHMMCKWKKCGVDRLLKEVYKQDKAVLTGISAGAICWFEFGHSDSESLLQEGQQFAWVEGTLGIYQGGFCPHYNEPGRDSFDEMLRLRSVKTGTPLVGYALDNNMAFVENQGKQYFLKCEEKACAYEIWCNAGALAKVPIEASMI